MNVLKKPLLTEKYVSLAEKQKQYGFIVDKKATKEQIKNEVEKVYDVKVDEVRTMVYAGKRKTRYTKRNVISGRKDGFKKAVISLAEGEIDFYSNI